MTAPQRRALLGRQAAAAAAADLVLAIGARAVRARGMFSLAFASGCATRALLDQLGARPAEGAWRHTQFFLADERLADAAGEGAADAIRRRLLAPASVPESQLHSVQRDLAPDAAASEYERTIRMAMECRPGDWPRFDLLVLGVAPDGRVAGLAPGSPALEERQRMVRPVALTGEEGARVTLTLPVLNSAGAVLLLAMGVSKAATVRRVLAEPDASAALPAAMIQPRDGELHWILDADAASALPEAQ